MQREACVCDHGFERSDLCAEIIIIIIIIIIIMHSEYKFNFRCRWYFFVFCSFNYFNFPPLFIGIVDI